MKLSIMGLALFCSLTSATEIDLDLDDLVNHTPTIFSHNFRSFDCPSELSAAILDTVNSAIDSGNLPILVCDMDKTLVKEMSDCTVPTDLYCKLRDSGVISRSHGVLVLTARSMINCDIFHITNYELEVCIPEFAKHMRSSKNFDGLTASTVPLDTRFLHDAGLLVMGNGGLTKRQVLDIYFQNILAGSNKTYELIFVDNEIHWFTEFCEVSGYDPKITKGHFFHYNWQIGEKMSRYQSMSVLDRLVIASSVPVMWDFEARSYYEDDDDDCCWSTCYDIFKRCCPWL